MCGIAGFLDPNASRVEMGRVVDKMTAVLAHRGPDDTGRWLDEAAGFALGHRRLSILDRSRKGRQPMVSSDNQYVVAFNGEIYNFPALRGALQARGSVFRSQCDTEVLLEAIRDWGVERALQRLNGMFAFALWDRQARALYLARDRLGEKPLYYGWSGKAFVFASELKAFHEHPSFDAAIDREALSLYFQHKYIPAPRSIYSGIRKLLPGTLLEITDPTSSRVTSPWTYWSLSDVVDRATEDPFSGTDEEAIDELDVLLQDSVRMRMIADVPIGGLLSGGIDSSTVVAMMQRSSDRPVKTFTVGLQNSGFDESRDAALVAQHLGTDHAEMIVTADDALEIIPKLSTIYDEPFGDSSQVPTALISQLARGSVTVGLSGDGGDELFGGYNRHSWGPRLWSTVGWMPIPVRRALAGALSSFTPAQWLQLVELLPRRFQPRTPHDKLPKLIDALVAPDPQAMYTSLVSHWKQDDTPVLGVASRPKNGSKEARGRSFADLSELFMYLDGITYLPDDILTKVDRASMAASLELRVPFLDHRVVEFAWQLPLSAKIRRGESKWLLRQVLHRYVPDALVSRPKMGFGIPIGEWLRGPLRGWAEDLLSEARLRSEGVLDPVPIRGKWTEHLAGKRNWQYHLWDVLMFQAWLDHWSPVRLPAGTAHEVDA